MKNKKVLITGGAGFIGSHLIKKLLKEGAEVHVFDMIPLEKAYRLKELSNNKNLIYTKGDLRSKSQIKSWYQNDASHLYHLASVVGVQNYMSDPLALIDIVVGGSRNLFELAASNNTRIIFTSTSEVYGKNPNTPWEESFDRVLGPTSIDRWSYSSSKAVCEHMLFALKKSHDLNFTILRFFNVYGPSQAPIFVVSKSIHNILNKKAPLLYDSGDQTRCFTFVEDAIEGVLKASINDNALSEVFNIGSNVETSMFELIKLIQSITKVDISPKKFKTNKEFGSVYEDIPRRIPNVEKAEKLLDWKANTSLEDGLKLCIKWSKVNEWWLK